METQQTSETERTPTVVEKEMPLGFEILELRILLCKSFYDFLKEYLQFFGSKTSVENLCTVMINDNVTRLYGEVQQFIGDKVAVRYADADEFAKKHDHLDLCASSVDEENEEEK